MRIFTILFFVCIAFIGQAQDRHFSQFYASPLTLNPALTGAFNGKYRVGAIYRDQWRRTLNNPYQTFAASLEVKFDLDQVFKIQQKDKVAVGLLFYTDKINEINLNTTQMGVSLAYHKALDANSKQYLILGFQGLLSQRNITYENLTFQDQFDGLTGYPFATDEVLPTNNFSYSDLSTGISYSVAPTRNFSLFAGAAVHHINRPQLSFYQEDEDAETGGDSKLFQRYSAQLSANIKVNNQLSLVPRALWALQGPHMELNIGTNTRVSISEYSGTALQFGGWVRPVGNEDGTWGIDALVLLVGLEHNGIQLGLSYDLNFDDLSTYRQGQNAFELSVAYIGEYDSETILCPKF